MGKGSQFLERESGLSEIAIRYFPSRFLFDLLFVGRLKDVITCYCSLIFLACFISLIVLLIALYFVNSFLRGTVYKFNISEYEYLKTAFFLSLLS